MACSVCKSLGWDGSGHNKQRCPHRLAIQAGHDGARKKPSSAYAEAFAELEPPPKDPLELIRWTQRILSVALFKTALGEGDKDLNSQLIGIGRTIGSLTPKDTLYEAKDLITRERAGLKQKARDTQPLTSPVNGSKPLR